MPPTGLAILLGAGPTAGAGIARILASPQHGNMAVALLSRTGSAELAASIAESSNGGLLRAFKTDTSSKQLGEAFEEVKKWGDDLGKGGGGLPLKLAVWNIKHSHKTPFAEETAERFGESLQVYVTGAMVFSQLCTSWMLSQSSSSNFSPSQSASSPGALEKKGTLIFTGTLGALRTNTGYAAYGAGRSGVRMLAQSLAREYSAQGVHVVHAIANGGITDDAGEGARDKEKVAKGEKMKAESVGRLYLSMMEQGVDLWCHEVDMRPAAEKF